MDAVRWSARAPAERTLIETHQSMVNCPVSGSGPPMSTHPFHDDCFSTFLRKFCAVSGKLSIMLHRRNW